MTPTNARAFTYIHMGASRFELYGNYPTKTGRRHVAIDLMGSRDRELAEVAKVICKEHGIVAERQQNDNQPKAQRSRQASRKRLTEKTPARRPADSMSAFTVAGGM